MRHIDLTGQKFGRLTALSRCEPKITIRGRRESQWLCVCECENKVVVQQNNLRSGHTQSCGCLVYEPNHVTHGLTLHPLYHVWASMKGRCVNPSNRNYRNYGGRGITVCQEWMDSLPAFVRDMGPTYRAGLTLDRIDNSCGYYKANCRWATRTEQQNNRRTNHTLIYNNESHTVCEWARKLHIKPRTLHTRLALGWPIEKVLTKPVQVFGSTKACVP